MNVDPFLHLFKLSAVCLGCYFAFEAFFKVTVVFTPLCEWVFGRQRCALNVLNWGVSALLIRQINCPCCLHYIFSHSSVLSLQRFTPKHERKSAQNMKGCHYVLGIFGNKLLRRASIRPAAVARWLAQWTAKQKFSGKIPGHSNHISIMSECRKFRTLRFQTTEILLHLEFIKVEGKIYSVWGVHHGMWFIFSLFMYLLLALLFLKIYAWFYEWELYSVPSYLIMCKKSWFALDLCKCSSLLNLRCSKKVCNLKVLKTACLLICKGRTPLFMKWNLWQLWKVLAFVYIFSICEHFCSDFSCLAHLLHFVLHYLWQWGHSDNILERMNSDVHMICFLCMTVLSFNKITEYPIFWIRVQLGSFSASTFMDVITRYSPLFRDCSTRMYKSYFPQVRNYLLHVLSRCTNIVVHHHCVHTNKMQPVCKGACGTRSRFFENFYFFMRTWGQLLVMLLIVTQPTESVHPKLQKQAKCIRINTNLHRH